MKVEKAGTIAFSVNNTQDSTNVSQTIYYKIKLTNTGNTTDTAAISRTSSLPLTWTLFTDVNENGVFDSGTDVVYDLAGNTGGIAQNDSMLFIAADTVGQNLADRSRDSAYYNAASLFMSASANGYTITRIKAPVMEMKKTVAKIGLGARSRPGDTLEYTITYTNKGSGSSNVVMISDVVPANTTFLADAYASGKGVKLNNVAKTNTGSDDEVTVSGNTISVDLGTVGSQLMNDSNYTGTIKFQVKIN
jgi:uncharacterized repeat protein (TIGR01451 family)